MTAYLEYIGDHMRTNTIVTVFSLVLLAFLLPGLAAGMAISAWMFKEGSALLGIPVWVFVSTLLVLLVANAFVAKYGEPGSTEKRMAPTAFLIFLPGVAVSFIVGATNDPAATEQATGALVKANALLTSLVPNIVYIACTVAVLISLGAVCGIITDRLKKRG